MNPDNETLLTVTLQKKLTAALAADGLPFYFDRARDRPARLDGVEGPLTRAAVSRAKSERFGFRARPYIGDLTWAELADLPSQAAVQPLDTDCPWHDYGLRYVGEREIKGPRHNPIIISWGKSAGIDWWNNDEDAWCAVAVNGWLAAAGRSTTRSALARSFMTYGTPLAAPKRGAIVVFPRGPNPLYGHVGTVEDVHRDGTITILNGNVGDAVRLSRRRLDDVLPNGIRWPDAP